MKPGLFALILILSVIALLTTVIKLDGNKVLPTRLNNTTVTPTPMPNIFGNEISFATSDKSIISATIYSPTNAIAPYKTIVLVHQFDSTRADWSPFIPTLLSNGYRVLAFDLRGMGESISTVSKEPSSIYLESLTGDLAASVEYLRGLVDTDKEHIGVIGSSIGANIAYVYSGSNQNTISATVAISPSTTKGPPQGNNITNFKPSNIFFVTDQSDSISSQVFFTKSANPKSIKIYPDNIAHGVELLTNKQTVEDILAWLKTNL